MAESEELRICSFNVNGLGNLKKRKDVLDYLRQQKGNIFFLQETHWKTETENFMRSQWGGECYVAGNDTASRGVAILFGNNFQYKVRNVRKDEIGRYILLDIEMLNKRITLVNIYAPSSGDNPEFFNNVFQQILQMDKKDIIISGDWNVALNPIIDTNQPSKVYR